MKSTLPLSSVEDFTDSLRELYLTNVATAAGVERNMVNITRVTAGSVIVETAVLVRGETDEAVDEFLADVKEVLAKPEEVFDSELGAVEVEVTESKAVDPEVGCVLCEPEATEEPDSHALAAAPLALALLSVAAAALLS